MKNLFVKNGSTNEKKSVESKILPSCLVSLKIAAVNILFSSDCVGNVPNRLKGDKK